MISANLYQMGTMIGLSLVVLLIGGALTSIFFSSRISRSILDLGRRMLGGANQVSKASMKRMEESIGSIWSNAQQTYQIIKTIEDIAFQYNLLVLNAAVEVLFGNS